MGEPISRREFLKIGGISLGVLALGGGLKLLDLEAGDIGKAVIVDILSNPEKTDVFLKATNYILLSQAQFLAGQRGVDLRPNPSLSPMLEIIKEGIRLYGKPVHTTYDSASIAYDREHSFPMLMDRIKKLDTSGVTGQAILQYIVSPEDIMNQNAGVKGSVAKFLQDANAIQNDVLNFSPEVNSAANNINSFLDLLTFYPHAGMVKRAREQSTNNDDFISKISQEIITPFNAIRQISENRSSRLSTAHGLAHYLKQSHGNTREAMLDTEIMLKALARNDLKTGKGFNQDIFFDFPVAEEEVVCDRFVPFLDQYSPLGGDFGADAAKVIGALDCQEDKDLSEINRIGVYQPWAIVNKVFFISPPTINIMTIGAMLPAVNVDQGRLKAVVDFNTLRELTPINTYLNSFS